MAARSPEGASEHPARRLVSPLAGSAPFKRLLAEIDSPDARPLLGGLTGSLFSVLAGAILERVERPLLIQVPGEQEAEGVFEDLRLMGFEDAACLLPPVEEDPAGRMAAVTALAAGRGTPCLVGSVRALVDPVPQTTEIERQRLVIQLGGELERDAFARRLHDAGFTRESIVESPGSYSVRGDVLDLFPPQDSLPGDSYHIPKFGWQR